MEKQKRGFAGGYVFGWNESPCSICGYAVYTWGRPSSKGGVWFSRAGHYLGWGKGLRARVCNNCGNTQLFIKDRL